MKYLLFILIALFGTFASESFATENQMACTKEYAPVCGSIQVQCFAAPCNPVRETFSNACVAKSRNATDVVKGECKDTTTVPPVIGGDTDIHGCKASAGYKWSALAGKCLRPWESRISTVTIAPVNDTCTDRDPKNCLQGKFGFQKDWFNFYGGISGFDYEYGYTYHLRILQTYSSHQSIDYSLIKVLSKKTISEPANSEILGNWHLVKFNTQDLTTLSDVDSKALTLQFTKDRFSAKFCNNVGGTYTLTKNVFSSPNAMSTMMYCEGLPMTLESAWNLDGSRYILKTDDPKNPELVVTTRAGQIFTFRK